MSDRSQPRYEAALKVTGQAQYEGEVRVPGMLHAALVETEIASGEVFSIDATQAMVSPGFAGLVTHADAARLKLSAATQLIRETKLHFPGQPVALVVAETEAQARVAARLVRVDARSTVAVTGLAEARTAAYAPAMVGRFPAASRRGDAGKALAEAHLVVRSQYGTAVNNHHPMEPHAVVCWWEHGRAIVHTCTQAIFGTRGMIAHAFDMAPADIRVVARYLGGGFGAKGQLWWPWLFWSLLASAKTGRPVRLELSRAQLFTLAGRRQETEQDLALGFTADGCLTAIEHHVVAQTSTHAEFSDSTAVWSRYLYACRNVTTSHKLVRTNEPQPIPMRAPGTAPGTFALESAMDEAAVRLGIDPIDLRLRNFADHDQEAARPWSSNSLRACYHAGAERFGWARRAALRGARDGRWTIGSGMATTIYPAIRQAARVHMRLDPDGLLLVQCGTQDMGSGTYTALAQIAADALGLAPSRVAVELGDTLLPDGPFSGGSQVTASIYPAVEVAGARMRAVIAGLAVNDPTSPLAGHSAQDLEFREGMIHARNANAAESIVDVLAKGPGTIEVDGEVEATQHASLAATGMGFGAIFVEAGVDRGLGEIRVRLVCGAFAAGRILNPLLARSQYVGGLIGGIGMALHERTVTDPATGHILGQTLSDYLIPVHADMPEFDIVMIEEDDPHLPGAVKGIGMLGTAGIQAAIANAVFDATGKRIRHLPIRIEDIV